MEDIKSLYSKAVLFKAANPYIELTVFQICSLAAAGVQIGYDPGKPNARQFTPEEIERAKALIPVFDEPFTASDMAAILFRVARPARYQSRRAARILRDELGLTPRKTNGRVVYDPPADDQK